MVHLSFHPEILAPLFNDRKDDQSFCPKKNRKKKATAAGICTWSPNVVRVLSSLTSSFGQSKVLYEG